MNGDFSRCSKQFISWYIPPHPHPHTHTHPPPPLPPLGGCAAEGGEETRSFVRMVSRSG